MNMTDRKVEIIRSVHEEGVELIDTAADDEVSGPAELAEQPPRNRLMLQFDACLLEFDSAGGEARGSRNVVRELLALGAIRKLYWLLCADGCASEAATVATWWEQTAPLHRLGKTI